MNDVIIFEHHSVWSSSKISTSSLLEWTRLLLIYLNCASHFWEEILIVIMRPKFRALHKNMTCCSSTRDEWLKARQSLTSKQHRCHCFQPTRPEERRRGGWIIDRWIGTPLHQLTREGRDPSAESLGDFEWNNHPLSEGTKDSVSGNSPQCRTMLAL